MLVLRVDSVQRRVVEEVSHRHDETSVHAAPRRHRHCARYARSVARYYCSCAVRVLDVRQSAMPLIDSCRSVLLRPLDLMQHLCFRLQRMLWSTISSTKVDASP